MIPVNITTRQKKKKTIVEAVFPSIRMSNICELLVNGVLPEGARIVVMSIETDDPEAEIENLKKKVLRSHKKELREYIKFIE